MPSCPFFPFGWRWICLLNGWHSKGSESWVNKPWGSASKQMTLPGTTRRQSLTDSLKCIYIYIYGQICITLEKEMATHSSSLTWRIPMDRGSWWAGVTKSWTWLSDWHTHMHNIELTILTILKCTIQWPSVPPWPNAITTSGALFIFANCSSILMEPLTPNLPAPSPWRPPFYSVSMKWLLWTHHVRGIIQYFVWQTLLQQDVWRKVPRFFPPLHWF